MKIRNPLAFPARVALVSFQPAFAREALAELRPRHVQILAEGIALIETAEPFPVLSARLGIERAAFVRHIAPVQRQVPLASLGDLADFFASANDLIRGRPTAIQARRIAPMLNIATHDLIIGLAANRDRGAPFVLSACLCGPVAFLGLSRRTENLSLWPGGEHRFRRDDEMISRAEFKLLEALALFDPDLRGGHALDLGAAPGGWTRVLRQRDFRVVAVDPAALDPRLAADPGVRHERRLAEDYLRSRERFDLIVNDMRVDVAVSVALMRRAAGLLRPGGFAIQTLKLSGGQAKGPVTAALDSLGRDYRIVGVRQLFHNRREVTVALRPLRPPRPTPRRS
jgi:23S rRNA (cytidine2498-2'-O)-methyltransferase